MTFTPKDSRNFFAQLTSPSVFAFLERMKQGGLQRHIPNISWDTARFLVETLRLSAPKKILEIWPANGFSTMILALACPDSLITSIECSRHAFEELRYNIQTFQKLQMTHDTRQTDVLCPAEFGPKVTSDICQEQIGSFSLYYADARELLPSFLEGLDMLHCSNPKSILTHIPAEKFDFIFIDGAFRMTREFFDLSLPLLEPGGFIILDDAIKYRAKMDGFHEYLDDQGITYKIVQTDDDDGVMVIDFWNNFTQLS